MYKFQFIGPLVASYCLLSVCVTLVHADVIPSQGTWKTTLEGRDLDGVQTTAEAYYDTVLGITWLANANAAGTTMNWSDANAWAAAFTLGGYVHWRLPSVTYAGTSACGISYTSGGSCGYNVDTTTGEMASLFYDTLGNLAFWDTSGNPGQPGWGLSNTGPFVDVQSYLYWTATDDEFRTDPDFAWYFRTQDGNQSSGDKTNGSYAWAVHDGDIGASVVPVPASVWLFGSGLLGLIGIARRKKSA